MSVDYKKYLPYIIKILVFVVSVLIIYYVGGPLFKALSPFILATLFAMGIEPQVKFMQKKFKFNRKASSLIALLCSIIVFGTILTLIIYKIIVELVSLSALLPIYFADFDFNNEIKYFTTIGQRFYFSIPTDVTNLLATKINETVTYISNYVTGLVSSILSFIMNFIMVLPQTLVYIIFTILATFFISNDKNKIKDFIFKQFPEHAQEKIQDLKDDLVFAFVGYIKAQIIIVIISAIVAIIGLVILRIRYAVTLGLIIGIVQLVPVVGTSIIFIPWIIYMIVNNNMYLAVGLLALFIFGIILRQIIEPKIVGDQIGLYPLVALISMYVGLVLMGAIGMIIGPVTVIVLKSLNKSNLINIWKE